MPRLRGKYKGKTGKIDLIEDILGTEELKGTYDARKKVTKLNLLEEKIQRAKEQEEIDRLKKEREEAVHAKILDNQKVADINRKISFILPFVLEPNAYYYIQRILREDPLTCREIIKYLFPPNDMALIDRYHQAIVHKGAGPKNKITYNTIDKIYRKIKGMGDRIGRKVA
ncbi:MAG: hypothetical protein GY853_16675 [PVC group bacterium]|nr:hypothetical protein [PVC group bacterium]